MKLKTILIQQIWTWINGFQWFLTTEYYDRIWILLRKNAHLYEKIRISSSLRASTRQHILASNSGERFEKHFPSPQPWPYFPRPWEKQQTISPTKSSLSATRHTWSLVYITVSITVLVGKEIVFLIFLKALQVYDNICPPPKIERWDNTLHLL